MKQCSRCRTPMTKGWFCCEEHFCSQKCLDESFIGTGGTWDEHYDAMTSEDGSGDCYRTEWEVAVGRDFQYRNTVSGMVELYASVDEERTVFKYETLERARKHHQELRRDGAGYLLIQDESKAHLWRNLERQLIA